MTTPIEQPLPPSIERQLSDLELRRKRHQQMLEDHADKKYRRRQDHKQRHFFRSTPPNVLI